MTQDASSESRGKTKNPKRGNFNLLLLICGNWLTAIDNNGLNASK